ncbi:ABC transporter ATP-binding protein [Paenibacillus sp. UNC451MF]|uniref:ABC transporter ATP-binding protein n=1 Tax=Paenibacillus sp. UNC451MF TaxID=1449063 RepID=UPI00048C53B5|nr:ATP-binding cassette domain-containing protein [Paenibacillus sp. UNC451MF]
MIQVANLNKTFYNGWLNKRSFPAVQNITFDIAQGETLGLVGESGCGKSTLSRLMLKLIPADPGGTIVFNGVDISNYSMKQMRPLRKQMQILFQHPDSALNPRQTIINSLLEPITLHRLMRREEGIAKVLELLELVGLQRDLLYRFPHQISGGQVQRVVIASALTLEPRLLVLDEPTSMLDVSVQAQVVEVLQNIQKQYQMAYLFISHDLDLVRHTCSRMAVMHQGRIVELRDSRTIMEQPEHPYTQQLTRAFMAYTSAK